MTILDKLMNNTIDYYLNNNSNQKYAVDVGCSNNSYIVSLNNYRKLCIDYNSEKLNQLHAGDDCLKIVGKVTPYNINNMLESSHIPFNFGFLNLDIDGYDFFVLEKILSKYQPYLICTEINEKIPPPIKFSVLYDENYKWDGSHFYGYSIMCLEDILNKYGYDLVKLEYNNCFLIKSELNTFGKLSIKEAYKDGYADKPDRKQIFYYNHDVDDLLQENISIKNKMTFINDYFSKYKNKYEISYVKDNDDLKITFGSIIFNVVQTLPKDMFKYCIDNIYEFAHEIFIVEGATKATTHYWDGDTSEFTKDGHSNDGTVEYLKNLKRQYPKIRILINQNGFWNGKTEMCNAYAKFATGDYVFQLDQDEFYHKKDIKKIIELLKNERPDAVHFYANHFFGGFDYCIDERIKTWGNGMPWMRIFKNIPGKSHWISHEPPEYSCNGIVCNKGKIITRDDTLKMGIKMYHYSYVSESQIVFKNKFYKTPKYLEYWEQFKTNKNIKIFGSRVFMFEGEHPDIIKKNYIEV